MLIVSSLRRDPQIFVFELGELGFLLSELGLYLPANLLFLLDDCAQPFNLAAVVLVALFGGLQM